jgi:GH25 family lysozyme M1 (1,4-beta-N-acetylmuramidase)
MTPTVLVSAFLLAGVGCPTIPEGWRRWAFWQHSSKGQLPGIDGPVDLDHFAGTLAQLHRFGRPNLLASRPPADFSGRDDRR